MNLALGRFSFASVSLLLLALLTIWHLSVGAKTIPFGDVISAFAQYDDSNFNHLIVRELRLPRAFIAMIVGASLGVAGAIIQGVTRNPIAEPSLLGLMAGAAYAVVLVTGWTGSASLPFLPMVAAVGALLAAALVLSIARAAPGGMTPVTLILAGSAVSLFVAALIAIHQLQDQETFEALRGWLVGSLSGISFMAFVWALPWLLIGLAGALLLAPVLSTLALGDEMAQGLGVNVVRRKQQLLVIAVMLTAGSVALVGPMAFVGLVIPHLVRLFVGADYRAIVPCSALFGAAYLVGVDSVARVVLQPVEISTGLVTAMIGAPCLVYLVHKKVP